MGIRDQDLEATGAVFATFSIKQTAGVDDLKDQDLGKAVQITSGNTIGPATDGSMVLGKLVDLSLTDADNGKRVATIQVKGVMSVPVTATYPVVGNRVVGGANATVKQAPALTGYDPVGGNIGRGTVIAVSGTTECTIIL